MNSMRIAGALRWFFVDAWVFETTGKLFGLQLLLVERMKGAYTQSVAHHCTRPGNAHIPVIPLRHGECAHCTGTAGLAKPLGHSSSEESKTAASRAQTYTELVAT